MKSTELPQIVRITAKVTRADGTVEDLGVVAGKQYTLWEKLAAKVGSWLR